MVREIKMIKDIIYFTRSVKPAVDAVEIWTEDNSDVNILNSFYTMVSVRFNSKKEIRGLMN